MNEALQLFVCMCAGGAAIAVPMSLRKSKLALSVWLAIYTMSYAGLSACGGYVNLESSEGVDRVWMPALCGEVYRTPSGHLDTVVNAGGAFFLPLVWIDRLIFHPG